MITKKAKQALPFDMQEELRTISQLAPVAPPPDKYLIALYGLMSDWRGSDGWKKINKTLRQYRVNHLHKQSKKSQFGTVIEITAADVSPSTKSKYVAILQYALKNDLTADELKNQIKKYGINDLVANIRKKKKRKKAVRASPAGQKK
jgi:hypothetical protein